jgi:uncharacterized protein YndB with AHSA1/START domain
MPDILHRVGIAASPEAVFEALTTIDGLTHWWTTAATGEPRAGGTIDFGFCQMKVAELEPNELVRWECVSGPDEWVGTEVTFRLLEREDQTYVLFEHAHWKEPVEFMHHCSTKWATFLLSLKNLLERDEGRPAPYDVKLHVGD